MRAIHNKHEEGGKINPKAKIQNSEDLVVAAGNREHLHANNKCSKCILCPVDSDNALCSESEFEDFARG